MPIDGPVPESRRPSRIPRPWREAMAVAAFVSAAWLAWSGVTDGRMERYFYAAGVGLIAARLARPTLAALGGVAVAAAATVAALHRGAFSLSLAESGLAVLWAVIAATALFAFSWMCRRRWWGAALLAAPCALALALVAAAPRNTLSPVVTRSVYVPMSDGVRIAVDYMIPRGARAGERLPVVMNFTRYHRSQALRFPFNILVPRGGGSARRFAQAGYAYMMIDVRGSGASFGWRDREGGAREVLDYYEVATWAARQPWSNGRLAAEGVSYGGIAAEMLALQGHPNVKAVTLAFSPYDAYTDTAFPGGMANLNITAIWGLMVATLDQNRIPEGTSAMTRLAWKGVRPVDGDDGTLLKAALAEHRRSYDPGSTRAQLQFRDDKPGRVLLFDWYPHQFPDRARAANVPTLVMTGWLDGGYQGAAFKRLMNVGRPNMKIVVGPWDHAAFTMIDPCPPAPNAAQGMRAEWTIPFYDRYLKDIANGYEATPPIRYYTLCGGGWRSARTWPPGSTSARLYLFDATLSSRPPAGAGALDYQTDPQTSTGTGSRWASLYQNLDNPHASGYPDRAGESKRLAVFTGPPLAASTEVTGHPQVRLDLASDRPDGALMVYLEDVAPNGRVTYVTEGVLRLSHRRVAAEPMYRDYGPVRSHLRTETAPMRPGQAEVIDIGMLPVSYRFAAGHRLRVSVAGYDKGNLEAPPGPPPRYTLRWSPQAPSYIDLPTASAATPPPPTGPTPASSKVRPAG